MLLVVVVIVVVQVAHGGGGSSASPAVASSSTSPVGSPTPTATPTPTRTAIPTAARTTPKPVVVRPKAPPVRVAVYNVSGSAAKAVVAQRRLTAAGYAPTISTQRFAAGASIVFWDPGNAVEQAQAAALVARHLGFTVAAPRPRTFLPAGELIAIMARSYA